MMRVLLFTDSDAFAGTERHMLDLGRALQDENVRVSIACPSPSPLADLARQSNLPVVSIGKRGLLDGRAVRRLRRGFGSREFDLVHAHNGRTALNACLAQTLARRGKVVMTQHFLEPDRASRSGAKGALSNATHAWMSRRLRGIVAISEAVANASRERGDDAGKSRVILNGIANPPEPKTSRDKTRIRYNVPLSAPLCVCAARLQPEKDIATLLRAWPQVVSSVPEARLLIAGTGALREELDALRRELKVGESAKLLGFVDDVPALMNAADVFCLPARAEPFGLVLVEAMAMGLPVVAAREGGPTEIVRDGETGLLVAPQNPEAFADALICLLRDRERAVEMGEAGRARFEERFTAPRMAREMANFYQEV